MTSLEIIIARSNAKAIVRLIGLPLVLLSLLLAAASAKGAAYYSTAGPVVATAPTCSNPSACGGVAVASSAQAAGLTLAATVYAATTGPIILRLPLNGTAPGGHRAGMLISTTSSTASLQALGTITIRTYLSSSATAATPREIRVVDASVVQAQLVASAGQPQQMEFTTVQSFDQVEIELAPATSLGAAIKVYYAYGIGPNPAAQISGYLSRFNTPSPSQYAVTGSCANGVVNPAQAVDADLTNYASFASLATVNCNGQLRANLENTAPGTYKAGFVIGQTNNLLDASVLSGLVLRTYLNGIPQESAANGSLLTLSALPDGKSLVNFQATKPFDAVAIERVGTLTALDNLQLYYGVGLASTTATPQVISSFSSGAGHYQTSTSGVCLLCSVTTPDNAAGDPNAAATVNVTAGVANAITMRLDLNGVGMVGNRAGMVIGRNSLLDVAALNRITLTTYDDAGNVLETATGSSLLSLVLLPNGRQTISFNTTRNFSKVAITIGGVASAVDTTNIYYAFSDNSNGLLITINPSPLPVTLTTFAVRRLAGSGVAEVSWTTASELNSASFVVERSTNPAAGFQAVGQVVAAGQSNTTRTYSLHDAAAATSVTTLYYRLSQKDTDGSEVLSSVVVLAAAPVTASFSLYPNPASISANTVTINTATTLGTGTSLNVYSNSGQLLSSQVINATDTQAALTVPTANLIPGLYYVVLRDAKSQALATQRLVVEK